MRGVCDTDVNPGGGHSCVRREREKKKFGLSLSLPLKELRHGF